MSATIFNRGVIQFCKVQQQVTLISILFLDTVRSLTMAGPNTHKPLNIHVGYFHIQSLYVITTYMTYFLHGLVQEVFQIEITYKCLSV